MELFRSHVLICGGTGCTSSGSVDLLHRFQELVKENHLEKEIKLVHTTLFVPAASACAHSARS